MSRSRAEPAREAECRDERTPGAQQPTGAEHDAELQRRRGKTLNMEPVGRGMSHWAGPA
jgi:hypothetical protein